MDELDNTTAESTSDEVVETQTAEETSTQQLGQEGEPDSNQTGEKSRLQKLIESKGGEDKFVDGLHESWKSMSRMQESIDQLREELAAKQANPEPEPLETNQDYQWFKNQITDLETDLQSSDKYREKLAREFQQEQMDLAVLEKTNGDARDIRIIKNRLADLNDKWEASIAKDKSVQREKAHYERQLKQAEAYINSARERQKREA